MWKTIWLFSKSWLWILNELSCNLILKGKITRKDFHSLSDIFLFRSFKKCFLKLSNQAQTLKDAIHNYFKKSCCKEHFRGILLKIAMKSKYPMFIQCMQFQFRAFRDEGHILKLETLKSCYNTIHPVDNFLLIHFMNKKRWVISLAVPSFVWFQVMKK